MNSNILTTLVFILYFCCVTICTQSSAKSSLFSRSDNFSESSRLYCLGGQHANGRISFSVSQLNTTTDQWESVSEMSTTRYLFGASVIGTKIFVCGGNTENERLNLLEVFDVENNTWSELAEMPNARDEFGMAALNGNIYVSGGYDASINILSSVLKYSPETNTWTEIKAMIEARQDHEMVTLHGAIYAIGGFNKKTVERYSPLIDKWVYVASTKYNHAYFGATSHQNKIFVLSENGFEVFHPESDSWQELPSLYAGRAPQLVSINDKLWAVGVSEGDNRGDPSRKVYEFDTINNTWIHLPDMDVARKYHRAVVVNF